MSILLVSFELQYFTLEKSLELKKSQTWPTFFGSAAKKATSVIEITHEIER